MTPKNLRPTGFIRRLMLAQEGLCFHCSEPMLLGKAPGPKTQHASREHIFPHATTGKGMVYNIVLAHDGCNSARGHRDPSPDEIARAARIYKILGIIPFVSAEASGIVFTPSKQRAAR
jgi:5-methylcytosine-specific restriction endonuclease McrA